MLNFQRYLCLICEVIRVSEENKELKFPYFGAKCEEFCKTMATIISSKIHFSYLICYIRTSATPIVEPVHPFG